MHNRYGKLASWVYDLDKPVGRSFGDVEYYLQRLAGCDGPVLEPAVGNGRILVPLLEAGLAVQGFDASEEMLFYCRQVCGARHLPANLTRQTFDTFSYDTRFAAIVVPAGSFQLVTDVGTARAVITRFRDHLHPGGRLILDLDPAGAFVEPAMSVRSWETDDGGLLTLTDQRVETDHVAQVTLSHLRYELWREGRLVDTELDLFRLRWWGVTEFGLALEAAGFTDVTVSGNYAFGRAPRDGDDIITFEARWPG